MVYLPYEIGLIIATCTKCASTSIRDEIGGFKFEPLTPVAVIELKKSRWKVVGIVREPIDRFESAYNFFQRGQQRQFPNGKKYENINHFVDSVLFGDADEHWLPQAGQLGLCDGFVDLENFPLSLKVNGVERVEKVERKHEELEEYSINYKKGIL